jgi:hypothetical protein
MIFMEREEAPNPLRLNMIADSRERLPGGKKWRIHIEHMAVRWGKTPKNGMLGCGYGSPRH